MLAMTLSLICITPVYAGEVSEVTTDHLAQAAMYEQRAQVQDDLIAEHTKMKEDYIKRYFINEKVSPTSKIKEMEKHCDSIINEASILKAELLQFAEWHRMRAAELQGQ